MDTPQQSNRPKATYTREQKGHSIVKWAIFGMFVLWIPAIYYTFSPNHYWHT